MEIWHRVFSCISGIVSHSFTFLSSKLIPFVYLCIVNYGIIGERDKLLWTCSKVWELYNMWRASYTVFLSTNSQENMPISKKGMFKSFKYVLKFQKPCKSYINFVWHASCNTQLEGSYDLEKRWSRVLILIQETAWSAWETYARSKIISHWFLINNSIFKFLVTDSLADRLTHNHVNY